MDVHLEQQVCVEGAHVQEVIEEGGEDSNTNVCDEEESHHLQSTPQWLYQLAHQDHCEDVHHHLPEVNLQEAVGECSPDPEVWWVEISRSD